MRALTILFALLAVVALVAAVWMALYGGHSPASAFLAGSAITQTADVVLGPALFATLMFAVTPTGADRLPIWPFAVWVLPAFGAAIFGYTAYETWGTVAATVTLHIHAPALSQALAPLALGLGGGAASAWVEARRRRAIAARG